MKIRPYSKLLQCQSISKMGDRCQRIKGHRGFHEHKLAWTKGYNLKTRKEVK